MRRLFRRNGLALVTFGLFLAFTVIMSITANREYNQDQQEHGQSEVGLGTLEYMGTARFWSESMENWQSEFLAVGSLVVLSVYLRQKGSPESKPVDHPHASTGG